MNLMEAIKRLDYPVVRLPKEVHIAMAKARKFERASARAKRGWQTRKGMLPPSEKTNSWNEFFGKEVPRNESYQCSSDEHYDREWMGAC